MLILAIKLQIVIPLIIVLVAQYIFAIFSLSRLIHSGMPLKKLIYWNFLVIFVLFVGSILALIAAARYKNNPPAANTDSLDPNNKDTQNENAVDSTSNNDIVD